MMERDTVSETPCLKKKPRPQTMSKVIDNHVYCRNCLLCESYCGVPLKAGLYLNRSGRPHLDKGNVASQLNPSGRCSLCSPQRILLRGWLTELTGGEGSDDSMRDSEESVESRNPFSGERRRRRTEESKVNFICCTFVNWTTAVITVNISINRDQIQNPLLITVAETRTRDNTKQANTLHGKSADFFLC
jgi:hypothetical protein